MGLKYPGLKQFYLLGEEQTSRRELDIGVPRDIEDLQYGIATEYTIVKPEGVAFQSLSGHLHTIEAVLACETPIAITVDGNAITEPRGPTGLPVIGNFYQIFPDHMGNHQRLFQKYGPIIKTNNLGRVNYFTNDPEISYIAYLESHGLFTKKTSDSGAPLYGIRDNSALFTCDTETPSFALTHKFIPPSMSPKAVRHYAPLMQEAVQSSFPVFDKLDQAGLAINVYQFMVKLSGQLLCRFVLGHDPHHFDAPNSPLHPIMVILGHLLELNKEVQTRGDWYGKMPFGAPRALQHCRLEIASVVDDLIEVCPRNETKDMPMDEAALKATCLVDYLTRATDSKGNKLPYDLVLTNTLAVLGAGFTTISALLSWQFYCLMTYEGQQDRLLQELVDHGVTAETTYTPELVEDMPFLDKFVKEALRIHSPAFQAGRNAKKDMILPGGYRLPKGAVLIPTFPAIHTNPKHWHDPQRFDPDRWDTDDVKNRHKTAYMPFAMGPRGCIGYNYALMQTKFVLCNMIYRYHWENTSPAAVEYDPEFQVIRPLNIYARAVKRSEWPSKSPGLETTSTAM
ncbi:putative cytochrome P450 [Exophiala viscosa]|uniref:Cytochrome P450 n=1 Tax=Exophiala viscosa TaxID=2486360 RepID=A0AAN6E4V3_9EURO|nr:putative cytochrome P450 [Exophiala viscosa]